MAKTKTATAQPQRKVTAGALSGAITTIIIFIAAEFGYELEPSISAAISTIIGVVISYIIPPKQGETVTNEQSRPGIK